MSVLERDVKTQIDILLQKLGRDNNGIDSNCIVFKQIVKKDEQKRTLDGKK